METGVRVGRAGWAAVVVIPVLIGGALGTGPVWARNPAVCKDISFDDEDEDAIGQPGEGRRFDFAGACARLTAAVNAYQQGILSSSVSGVPLLVRPDGTPSSARRRTTLEAIATIETKRNTALGEVETGFEAKWSKLSDDGTKYGSVSIQELWASLAGWTAGYTESLMNFWSGDFQAQATAPNRTVGIVSYERELTEHTKLAVAVESGLPTSRQATEGIQSLDFSSPLLTARWLYEKDDYTVHLSGLVRRAEFPANPSIPFLPQTATTRVGWAVSFGVTAPVKAIGEDDEVSMQATYAVDASPFLGTSVDLSTLSSIVPTTGPTVGWSIVASYSRSWSDHWESNVYVSYLALDAQLIAARPSVRTARAGANVYWRPRNDLRFGAEIAYLRLELERNGVAGFLNGVSGSGFAGSLAVEWAL